MVFLGILVVTFSMVASSITTTESVRDPARLGLGSAVIELRCPGGESSLGPPPLSMAARPDPGLLVLLLLTELGYTLWCGAHQVFPFMLSCPLYPQLAFSGVVGIVSWSGHSL